MNTETLFSAADMASAPTALEAARLARDRLADELERQTEAERGNGLRSHSDRWHELYWALKQAQDTLAAEEGVELARV